MRSTGNNDVHLVSYAPECFTDSEAHNKQKPFRKWAVINTDKNFHYKYWILEDKAMAEQLKINTERPYDIYVLREAETLFLPTVPEGSQTADINGYKFESRVLLTKEEVQENFESCFMKILQLGFEMPMICNNVQQFVELRQKYPWANLLVVYCDHNVHG